MRGPVRRLREGSHFAAAAPRPRPRRHLAGPVTTREAKREMARIALGQRAGLAVVAAASVVGALGAALAPLPLKFLIDVALGGNPPPSWVQRGFDTLHVETTPRALVLAAAAAYLAVALVNSLTGAALASGWAAAGNAMVGHLVQGMYARILRTSEAVVRRLGTGDLVTRLSVDGWSLYTATSAALSGPASQVLGLVSVLSAAVLIDAQLTLVVAVVAPLLALVGIAVRNRLRNRSREEAKARSRLTAIVHQTVVGLPTVQLMVAGDRHRALFAARAREWVSQGVRRTTLDGAADSVSGVLAAAVRAAVLLAGGYRVLDGDIEIGTLVAFLSYSEVVGSQVRGLAAVHRSVKVAGAGIDRSAELLTAVERVVEPVLPVDVPVGPPRVEFRGVWFAYESGDPVLRGVDLVVPARATVALVGRTGAGKTTLASLVPRLFDPTRGTVTFDGVDVRDMSLRELRRRVAVVSQDPHLFPVSVAENIAYGRPDASRDEVMAAARSARAHDFVLDLAQGYETTLGDGGTSLSGGQRQRIAIARALLKDAPVLLMDEPTSALDTHTEAEVMDAIGRLVADRTVLVIAHRLSTIRLADQVAILDGGRVVEVGAPGDLLGIDSAYGRHRDLQVGLPDTRSA